MHAVVRSYSGRSAADLFDLLEKRKADVERIIRGVKGFVAYSLVRTADGGFSISVYQNKAGSDESSAKAHEWIVKNAANLNTLPPTIVEGDVILEVQ